VTYELKYRPPGDVARAFLKSRPASPGDTLPIDVLIGPIGSGKSVAACIRVFLHAMEQPPGTDGWRRSRWAVIRNTGPMLETTTIPTWLEWFPEEHFGRFNWSPPYSHTIKLPEAKVELEVLFLPLDRPEQVRALLSLELTGGWINEGREVPREIAIALRSRCGRYPSLRRGSAPGWSGVLIDTNAPESRDHYLAYWAGWSEPPEWMDAMTRELMAKPEGVNIFVQPPGMKAVRDKGGRVLRFEENPKAENQSNLRPGYYRSQLAGSTTDWILNMICVETRSATPTRPVHPDFREELHVAPAPLLWEARARYALLAMDFARNPALLLAQDVDGQLRVLDEWIGTNESVEALVRRAVPEMNMAWPEALRDAGSVRGWGDPSGSNRTGGDDSTAFTHARAGGLTLQPAWTNDPDERQAAVDRRLGRLVDGQPALLVSPRCRTLIAGLAGGYRFKRVKVEGTFDKFADEPEKNLYSHICDALQYLCLGLDRGTKRGADEQRRVAAQAGPGPNGRVRYDPFAVARAARRFGKR
jgi:hypothetical protein